MFVHGKYIYSTLPLKKLLQKGEKKSVHTHNYSIIITSAVLNILGERDWLWLMEVHVLHTQSHVMTEKATQHVQLYTSGRHSMLHTFDLPYKIHSVVVLSREEMSIQVLRAFHQASTLSKQAQPALRLSLCWLYAVTLSDSVTADGCVEKSGLNIRELWLCTCALVKHITWIQQKRRCTCVTRVLCVLVHFSSQPTRCQGLHSGDGCLAITNAGWVFREAYLTCYSHNDTCSDVSFSRTNTFGEWHACTLITYHTHLNGQK